MSTRLGYRIVAMARGILAGGLLLVWSAGHSARAADPGVTADKIVFGQSAALDGPAKGLGLGMNEGLRAAFAEANRAGGVNGRSLELTALNDGYEPDRAVANTTSLIEESKVFALVGAVGTPTAAAAQPLATAAQLPFIGAFTGAGFLRDPKLRNVINVRASYDQETETWIERLTQDLGLSRIAILYQDDSFGRAGLSGVRKAMARRNMSLVAEGLYPRNTTAVKTAFLTIRKAKPEAVVMVGAYAPCAKFIKVARSHGLDQALFVNISFVGSDALAQTLGNDGKGVIITQVVPFPTDNSLPLVADYHKALKATDPAATPGFVSLEGYMVGRLIVAALKLLPDEPTRAALLDTIYRTRRFDLGGVILTFGEGDNQGMDQVFLTRITAEGGFQAIERLTR